MVNSLEEFLNLYYEKNTLALRYLPSSRRGYEILTEFISREGLGCSEEVYEYLLSRYDNFLTMKDLADMESRMDFFGEEKIRNTIARIRKEKLDEY